MQGRKGCLLIGVLAVLWLCSAPGFASCGLQPDRAYRPDRWDVVFLGRVEATKTRFDLPEEWFGLPGTQVVRFEPLAGWKGVEPGSEVLVLTARGEEAPVYRPGALYVVWASRRGLVEGNDPLIGATCIPDDYCNEPSELSLRVLRQLRKPEWFRGESPARRCNWK